MKTNKNLVELFGSERWLYVDGSLNADKILFWDNRISENQELKNLLLEVQNFTNDYTSKFKPDLNENKFDTIMKNVFKAGKQNSLSLFVKKFFALKNSDKKTLNIKLAFSAGILFALISFLFLLQKPTSNYMKNSNLFVWNDTSFSKNLSVAEFEYTSLADEKVAQYIQYQLANDKWLRDVVSINNEIVRLNKTTNNNSF